MNAEVPRIEADSPGAAARVLDVLCACVEAGRPVGVTELASQLGLSKAVVFRILRVMLGRDLLTYVESTKKYALGPLAFRLGARIMAGSDLRSTALPIMRELRDLSAESVSLGILTGERNTYVEQVPSLQEVRLMVELGRPFPLVRGAQGKVTLAFAPPVVRERVLGELSPDDRRSLERELADIAVRGTAVSLGERVPGAAAVAAPIFGMDGSAAGSIAICGPRTRFDQPAVARYRKLVAAAAGRITEQFSGHRPMPRKEAVS